MAEVLDEPSLRNRVRVFRDRLHAGEALAERLESLGYTEDAYLLAIPAGGMQVACIIAERLGLPLDLVVTRKLHVPWNREAGFGAVSWDGLMFLNERLVAALGLTEEAIRLCVEEERTAIERRLRKFRGEKPFPDLEGKTALVVDDGLASGFSMMTTLRSLANREQKELVVAVPTAPRSAIELVKPHADLILCLNIRTGPFFAVADAYEVWYDLEDEYVVKLLEGSRYRG
jgi:predicted phosphoribosyltransferase